MKASKIIEKLQKFIDNFGDEEVFLDECRNGISITDIYRDEDIRIYADAGDE